MISLGMRYFLKRQKTLAIGCCLHGIHHQEFLITELTWFVEMRIILDGLGYFTKSSPLAYFLSWLLFCTSYLFTKLFTLDTWTHRDCSSIRRQSHSSTDAITCAFGSSLPWEKHLSHHDILVTFTYVFIFQTLNPKTRLWEKLLNMDWHFNKARTLNAVILYQSYFKW